MEEKKKNHADTGDKDIVYSQPFKAGKRIYYLDVKKSRKDEMFLTITESKKIVTGEGDDQQVTFEKHKIFLYQEDFDKFMNSLQNCIGFIRQSQGEDLASPSKRQDLAEEKDDHTDESPDNNLLGKSINIDIDF